MTVGDGASQISVYVMAGSLLAADSPDDNRQLVHLLQRQGVLRRKIVTQLEAAMERSEPVFGELLRYAGAALDMPLVQRFENNLATFLGSISKPKFAALRGVFVDNIQMGLDPKETIDRASALWDRASALDVDVSVQSGGTPFENDQQLWVAKAVGKGDRTISAILLDLPMEELHARLVVMEMLERGIIRVASMEAESPEPPTDHGDASDPAEPDPSGESFSEQDTVYGFDVAEVTSALQADAAAQAGAAPEPEPEELDDLLLEEIQVDEISLDESQLEEIEPDGSVDAAPRGKRSRARKPSPSVAPSSLDQWMEQASVVDEEELDFFADHDFDRGSDESGAFSSKSHNLDRIDVGGVAPPPPPEVIEADEAPATKFSAPVLEEDEAFEKIGVANDVLQHVVRAFDTVEGAGRGRAVVQLLVDGSPSRFAVLLHDLVVTDEGELPGEDVLGNLYSRPASEHRQLINQALVDIIERALSSAADELPDEQFDDMYEAVAGYRQRLGL